MKRLLTLFSLCLSLIGSVTIFAALEETPIPFASAIELNDGDTFVFLGDSITHQCLYTQYVETYFYTRYPEKRIHFRNAGVSGDAASDALLRFDEDVAAFEPDYVSVLLGMNDGKYRHFDHEIFAKYETGMKELISKLGDIAEAIPMGPTYFDSRSIRVNEKAARWVKVREPMRDYYEPVLGFYSEWVAEQAQLAGLNFVDMSTPMRRVTFEERRADPRFTLSNDAVHPGPTGHVVMAAAMLSDAFKIEPVSTISLALGRGSKVEETGANGRLENLKFKRGRLSFDFTATGLPWGLPADAQEGYELADAGKRFSQEFLQVAGLKSGTYELLIDLVPIARFSAAQLELGVDLQPYAHSPQAKQALAVARLNQERNEKAIKPLRNLWLHRKSKLRGEEKWLAANRADPEYEARKASFDEAMELFRSKALDLEQLARDYEDKIYAANQPLARSYVLKRAEP